MQLTDTTVDLVHLLSSRGWTKIGSGDDGSLWRDPTAASTVAVPDGLTVASYEWPGIVDRIALGLGLERHAILDLIQHQFVDVTELRAEAEDDRIDSVLLATGLSLVESARVLVRASATASRTERLSIDGHYLRSGEELAAKARMGHTRPGSYVLPILMPLPRPTADSPDTLYSIEQFVEADERRVTRTLAQALAAIQSQIVEPAVVPDGSALGNLLLAGATREAVVAIERLLQAQGVSGVSAHFMWAAGVTGPAFLPSEVSIPSEAAPLLRDAAARMRKAPQAGTERLIGRIVEMRDPQDGQSEVSVQTVRKGRACEIRVAVPPALVEQTHDWFRSHDEMIVSGTVVSARGKPLRIPDPTTFTRLADTSIF